MMIDQVDRHCPGQGRAPLGQIRNVRSRSTGTSCTSTRFPRVAAQSDIESYSTLHLLLATVNQQVYAICSDPTYLGGGYPRQISSLASLEAQTKVQVTRLSHHTLDFPTWSSRTSFQTFRLRIRTPSTSSVHQTLFNTYVHLLQESHWISTPRSGARETTACCRGSSSSTLANRNELDISRWNISLRPDYPPR
jgi:hypothetical protein